MYTNNYNQHNHKDIQEGQGLVSYFLPILMKIQEVLG